MAGNMLYRTLRAVAVLLAVLAIDFCIVRADLPYRPSIAGALTHAFLVAQIGLCAIWLAIGRDPAALQVPVTACLGLGVWHVLVNWGDRAVGEFAPGYWTQVVVVMVVLVGLRALSFRMERGTPAPHAAGELPLRPRFSIRDLMIATFVVAASLALLTQLNTMNIRRDQSMISIIVGGFLGALTLMSVMATLVVRRAVLWTAVTCSAGFLVGLWVGLALEYDLVASTLALGMPIALQTVALLLVRLRGYRIVRCPSTAAT